MNSTRDNRGGRPAMTVLEVANRTLLNTRIVRVSTVSMYYVSLLIFAACNQFYLGIVRLGRAGM